ncbi:hypothetical protein [Planctobacterium marinum]|uniref:Uncharacterized protein n=1 Tax=Planctobacterium marinum TaxID=1631968 RepID=A0AA48HX35_9ALTE|nr:hypothetical protein MACH26_17110 [Planctobacterium marinum]
MDKKDTEGTVATTEFKPEYHLKILIVFFKRNPALMLSVSYLLLTLCGILYSASFYNEFNINIMKLAQISDLLIVGISEPAAVLMFSGGLIVAAAFDMLVLVSYPIHRRWKQKPASIKRSIILFFNYVPKNRDGLFIIFLLVSITYAKLFVTLYAEWRSEDIKSSKEGFVSIKTGTDSESQKLKILGSTTNLLLVYDATLNEASAIGMEDLVSIRPIASVDENAQNEDNE